VGKPISWVDSDTEVRKLGEQTGLDTRVVLAVNDAHWVWVEKICAEANAISEPPGEYVRKDETQRN
jgi:hypothetical protein